METSTDPLEVARRAFGHFTRALATADWLPFFDCLSDDVEVWFPTGRFKGVTRGKEKVTAFFRYVSEVYPRGLAVTLDRVTAGGTTAVFEFHDEGLLFGTRPYANRVAVAFDVRDGRICAYREYFGSDGEPGSLQRVTG